MTAASPSTLPPLVADAVPPQREDAEHRPKPRQSWPDGVMSSGRFEDADDEPAGGCEPCGLVPAVGLSVAARHLDFGTQDTPAERRYLGVGGALRSRPRSLVI